MAAATRRSKYGSLNWEDHQSTLKRLYLDQDMTLADVATIMKRDYNFAPSKGAYKREFASWGWHKNLTAKVALSMESKARKRQRESEKETVFEFGGRQLTTTEVEQVAARSKRARITTGENVSRSTTPIGVTYKIPRDSTESPVPGALEDLRPHDASTASSELNQETDMLADAQLMAVDPITHDVNTAAGASELTNYRVNEHRDHGLIRWPCGGESSHQSGSGFSLCPTARDAILPDLSQESLDKSTTWKINEHLSPPRAEVFWEPVDLDQHNLSTFGLTDQLPSPRLADMFWEPLSLDQFDFSTPRQTPEFPSSGAVFLESRWFSSPPPTIPLDRRMNQSWFTIQFIGSPWSLFQSAVHSTLSTNADTSLPALRVPRGIDTGDTQPSLSDLAYSMLPHSNGSTAGRNLGSALEQIVPIYFPVDEAQRLQCVPALSGNPFIEQLVTAAFGMIANGVLSSEGIEQFLNIMKNYAPKPLLRQLLNIETLTARAALRILLKNVIERGDMEALDFLLAFEIRKELLSGTEGAKLLEDAICYGKTEMAKRIALAGADPNFERRWGSPLSSAVEKQDLEFVEILLKAGAKVNPQGNGKAPLSAAVDNNNHRCVSMLLESGAIVDTCTVASGEGWPGSDAVFLKIPVLDYAYLCGYNAIYQLLRARSATARSHLTISGIIIAARAGLNQLETYLERRVYDNAEYRTTLLEKALSCAIRHNTDDKAIYVLLDFGVDPDTPTLGCWELPLCSAIPNNRLVRRLLDAGADLNHNSDLIIKAAALDEENYDSLGLLIMEGLNLQTLGSIGLGMAIWDDNMAIMKLLLRSGAPATGCDYDGWCLVAVATHNQNREALHLLLQHGADVNVGGRNGGLPIHKAVAKGDLEMTKVLVENGALLDQAGLRDKRYRTVLEEWASQVKELWMSDLFTFLLENGAPVNAQEVIRHAPHWNSLLTTLILRSADDDLIRQVLEKGAHVNDMLPTIKGARTPIQAAAEMGKLDLVREFHEKGANINAPPGFKLGRTALQAACNAKRANIEVVVYLLDNEADINANAGYDGGVTALQGAAIQGNIKLVILLLDRGADLNAEAAIKNGRTALEGAAEYGRLDMVYLLLSAGAKCQREGTTGYDSAIELAKKEGHWEIVDLLLKSAGVTS